MLIEQGGRYAEMFATWSRQYEEEHVGAIPVDEPEAGRLTP